MTIVDAYSEHIDLGGGQTQATIHAAPNFYFRGGIWQPNNLNWANGDASYPNVVTQSKMTCYVASDGMRRICPTGDTSKYLEVGAPYIKPSTTWQKVNLGSATRTANKLSWTTAQADVNVYHGGHYIKLEIPLKGGWQPPNGQFAFPVGLQGLTRSGGVIYDGATPVMYLQRPVVYDAANPRDVRQITYTFTNISSQAYILFTLPSLAGMISPVIDPTFTDQPDATAGLDTYILKQAAAINYGTSTGLKVSNYFFEEGDEETANTLIKFDLSSIASGSTVTSAVLSLYQDSYTLFSVVVDVHRCIRAWVESQATWNIAATGTNWGTAGCNNTTTDRESASIGSQTLSTTNSWYDFTLTNSKIQEMLTGGVFTNNGFVLRVATDPGDNNVHNMRSSDHATASTRPKIVIDYTAPAAGTVVPVFMQSYRRRII